MKDLYFYHRRDQSLFQKPDPLLIDGFFFVCEKDETQTQTYLVNTLFVVSSCQRPVLRRTNFMESVLFMVFDLAC